MIKISVSARGIPKMSFRPKPCPICGSPWHSKGYHNQRKPLRKEAVKTRAKRLSVRDQWFGLYEPDSRGYWYCYLQISPQCPRALTKDTLVLEHELSKARHPNKRYVVKNIKPACEFCNKLKGSLSAEEARAKYGHH